MTHDEAVAQMKLGECPFLKETQLVDENTEWRDALLRGGLLRETDFSFGIRPVQAMRYFRYGVIFPDGTKSIRFYLPNDQGPREYTPEAELAAIQDLYLRTMNKVYKLLAPHPSQTGLQVIPTCAIFRVSSHGDWVLVRNSLIPEPETSKYFVVLEDEFAEWKEQGLGRDFWYSVYLNLAKISESPQFVELSEGEYSILRQLVSSIR